MMQYEALRRKYQDHQKALARLIRLEARAKSGNLSHERLAACELEITRLSNETDRNNELFARLETAKDPVWMKMSRELDAALAEYTDDSHNPTSMRQMVGKFVGTMVLLILGTWIIDGLRKK